MKIEVFYLFHVVELSLIYWEEVLYLDLNIARLPSFLTLHCDIVVLLKAYG